MPSDPQASADLRGKAILVTGGARGLGRGIVELLAVEGARLAIAGRDLAAAEEAARDAAKRGATAIALRLDVRDPDSCAATVAKACEQLGELDGLVNNAALFELTPLIDASVAQFDAMIETNTRGPFVVAQAFARRRFAKGGPGAIVNISSIASARPALNLAFYSASKAALESLTRTMAAEWTPRGVRVNAVAPGHIETEGVTADFAAGRLDREAMVARIPARRIAAPQDVAEGVSFLLSERARHITGVTLTVDGGEGM